MAEAPESETGRLLAFTDGVFAIVITLLVLEVQIPEGLPEKSVGDAIAEVGPSLTAWVISFLITGMYWVWHRDTFTQVKAVNRDLLWLNLLYLLPVSLIPFAASVLGRYDREPHALRLYGAVLIVASVMRVLMLQYLLRRPALLVRVPSAETRRTAMRLALFPILMYAIAIGLANVRPVASLILFLVVPGAYFAFLTLARSGPENDEATDFA